MNARVGNQTARPIDPRLVAQAVGPIQGVVPTAARNQVQGTAQGDNALILLPAASLTPIWGTGGQFGQPMASQPPAAQQGSNTGTYGSQPQVMRAAQPQQPMYNPQGNQQYHFNPPMTQNNQQNQAGHTTQQVAQSMGPGGTAASGNIPIPSQYPHLPPSHGIPGRRGRPPPGAQQTWRVDGPR
jgi:hypothetical protein